jgi:hypothetical protein
MSTESVSLTIKPLKPWNTLTLNLVHQNQKLLSNGSNLRKRQLLFLLREKPLQPRFKSKMSRSNNLLKGKLNLQDRKLWKMHQSKRKRLSQYTATSIKSKRKSMRMKEARRSSWTKMKRGTTMRKGRWPWSI